LFEDGEGPEQKFDQIGGKSPFLEPNLRKIPIEDNPVKKDDSDKASNKGIGLSIQIPDSDIAR